MSKKFEIENWMVSDKGLSGNELVLFAIMWEESGKGQKSVMGDYAALSAQMGTTIPTLYNCLKKLAERGLIVQEKKGEYRMLVA